MSTIDSVRKLNHIPVFGFETASCNAAEIKKETAKSIIPDIDKLVKGMVLATHKHEWQRNQLYTQALRNDNATWSNLEDNDYRDESEKKEEREIFKKQIEQHPEYIRTTNQYQRLQYSEDIKIDNAIKIFGYIPILGFFIGKNRIKIEVQDNYYSLVITDPTKKTLQKIAIYARGVFEILGLGIVFLIPDLIATVYYRTFPNNHAYVDPYAVPAGT